MMQELHSTSKNLLAHYQASASVQMEEQVPREERHKPSHFEPKFKIFDVIK